MTSQLESRSDTPSPSVHSRIQLTGYHQELGEIASRVDRFDFRALEAQADEEREALIAETIQIASDTSALLSRILGVGPASSEGDAASGATSISSASLRAWSALEQVAFLASLELDQSRVRVMQLVNAQGANLVVESGSLVRKTRRAVVAVDQALAASLRVEGVTDVRSSLESAIRVRKAFARFRRASTSSVAPTEEEVLQAVRRVGTAIATLIGKPAYGEMRYHDRMLFQELQQRVLAWLRTTEHAHLDGLRIWQDFRVVVTMTRQINQRPELMAHDNAILEEVVRRQGELNEELWGKMEELEGYHDDLDHLIGERNSGEPLLALVQMLRPATGRQGQE